MIVKSVYIPAHTEIYFHAKIYTISNTGQNPIWISKSKDPPNTGYMIPAGSSVYNVSNGVFIGSNHITNVTMLYEELEQSLWDRIEALKCTV